MTPKDFSINMKGFIVSTAGLSKEGILFNHLNEKAQKILSIFNTDADKTHLSKQELTNAILYFKKSDTENDETQKVGTKVKPDGYLNWNELAQLAKRLNKSLGNVSKSAQEEPITDGDLTFMARNVEDVEHKTAAANKQGLKLVKSNSNIARGSDGTYYLYDNDSLKFKKSDIQKVNKDGSYRRVRTNKKAQKTVMNCDETGFVESIQARNSKNKNYIKPNYAAKVAGLTQDETIGDHFEFKEQPNQHYKWNSQTHSFEAVKGFHMHVHQQLI